MEPPETMTEDPVKEDPMGPDAEKAEVDPLVEKPTVEVKETATHDAIDTMKLAVPLFFSMLSWVGMRTTDTALLGHVSARALAASALSDLWTMCTSVLVQGSILSVLVGGAVGAGNPKLGGIYLQVAYFVLSFVAVFVIICWGFTGLIWIGFGAEPDVADDAGYYAQILSIGIPGLVAFSQLSQFFSAQRIMQPEVRASSFALIMNLLLGLPLVLGIPIPNFDGFRFVACPIVTTSVVYVQLCVFVVDAIFIHKFHRTCWGGWSYQEITWDRIKTFSALYFPAALAMASDFWRVAVIGFFAARLGTTEVAVFNTSYRIMWITLIIANAIAGATGIKMNVRFGSLNHEGARQAAYVGMALCAVVLFFIAAIVVWQARHLMMIFTPDPHFLDKFAEARWPFTITLFLMSLSVALEKVPYSMGRTTEVFWMGLIASWGGQVPGVILLTTFWRPDLIGLYTGMAIGYGIITILYTIILFTSDWKKYAEKTHDRAEHDAHS